MADLKISQLTGASTPLAGTEVLPIVQSGSTVKVSVANLTAGRAVGASTVQASTGFGVGVTPTIPIQIQQNGTATGLGLSTNTKLLDGSANKGFQIGYSDSAQKAIFLSNTTGATSAIGFWAYDSGGSGWAERLEISGPGNVTFNTGNLIFGTADKGVLDSTSTVSIKFKSTAAYLSGGDFYINTSTALSSTAKLQISNGTGRAIATAGSSGDVGTESLRLGKFDNDSTTSQLFVRFTINNDGAGSGQINANGASAAAFGTYSDERLKENIVNLPSQISNICALRPVEFDYKDGSGHQIGFIAQEMQQIYPDVVSTGDEGMLTVTGWSKTEARLVKAIQEQQSLIEVLTTKLTALEKKVG